jgi:hypothetical protein
MPNEQEIAKEILAGPKPIAVTISTIDIQMLVACNTSPTQYIQLILAKLKDAGAPVEGTLNLKLAHGKLFKMKDNPLEEKDCFTYIWLPEAYVDGMRSTQQGDSF